MLGGTLESAGHGSSLAVVVLADNANPGSCLNLRHRTIPPAKCTFSPTAGGILHRDLRHWLAPVALAGVATDGAQHKRPCLFTDWLDYLSRAG
jgi:hypothetical protein